MAQYNGTREAACRVHDENIGVGNVFHLFRLPAEIEQDLHRILKDASATDEMLRSLQDKETAFNALMKIAGGVSELREGPVAMGQFQDLHKADAPRSLAGAYLTAFQRGVVTYPYFGK